MARTLIGRLVLSLQAKGLGEANKVARALDQIERKALKAGSKGVGSWGVQFQRQLDKFGLAAAEIRKVEDSWKRLYGTMNNEKRFGSARAATISHWKTDTISRLARERAQLDQHFRTVEKSARAHSMRVGNILRPGFVMMGAYTGTYFAGMMGVRALDASAGRRREQFRQRAAAIPENERGAIFDRAEELSARFPTIPITQIMEMARTARNTMGDTERGLAILDDLVQAFVALQSAKGIDTAVSELDGLIRGIDNLGQNASGELGIKNTKEIIDAMVRASQIEGMQFDPGKFWQFARRSKIAGPALSTDFLGAVAPAFMQDLSPDSFGMMLSSAYKAFVIGASDTASKVNLAEQRRMGLRGRTGNAGKGTLVDDDLFGKNPYAWVQKHLIPALKRDGIDLADDTAVTKAVAKLSRNSFATGLLTRMVTQREQIERLIKLYEQALGKDIADEARHNDPYLGWQAFKSSLSNLSAALIPIDHINAGLNGLADGINALARFSQDYPELTWLGAAGVAGAGYFGGKAIFKALSGGFGLKTSALALNGSAAALTRAAAALGASAGADVAGGGPWGRKGKGVGRGGHLGKLGGLGGFAAGWAAHALRFTRGRLAVFALLYDLESQRTELVKKYVAGGMSLNEATYKSFEDMRARTDQSFNWLIDAAAEAFTSHLPKKNKSKIDTKEELQELTNNIVARFDRPPTLNEQSTNRRKFAKWYQEYGALRLLGGKEPGSVLRQLKWVVPTPRPEPPGPLGKISASIAAHAPKDGDDPLKRMPKPQLLRDWDPALAEFSDEMVKMLFAAVAATTNGLLPLPIYPGTASGAKVPVPTPRPEQPRARPSIDASEAVTTAEQAGQQVKDALSITVKPHVNTESIDKLLAKARAARAELRALAAEAEAEARKLGIEVRRSYSD